MRKLSDGYTQILTILITATVLFGGLQLGAMVGHDQLQFYLGNRDLTIVLHSTAPAKYYEVAVGFDNVSFRSQHYQCSR